MNVNFYSFYLGGVDNVDKMLAGFSSKRKTNRWPVAVFGNILDISAFNAFTLFCKTDVQFVEKYKKQARSEFLEKLTLKLAAGYMSKRNRGPYATNPPESTNSSSSMESIASSSSVFVRESRSTPVSRSNTPNSGARTPLSRPSTPVVLMTEGNGGSLLRPGKRIRGRCFLCPKESRCDNSCVKCNRFVCKSLHGSTICDECLARF